MGILNAQGLPVQLILQPDRNVAELTAQLSPGMTLRGRVTEVLGDGRAVVNFRGISVTAELRNVALSRGEVITVSVQDTGGTPVLRLQPPSVPAMSVSVPAQTAIGAALDRLGLPHDGFHAAIVQLLEAYGIPATRESALAVKDLAVRLPVLLTTEASVPEFAAGTRMSVSVPWASSVPNLAPFAPSALASTPVTLVWQSIESLSFPPAAPATGTAVPAPAPLPAAQTSGYVVGRMLASATWGAPAGEAAVPATPSLPAGVTGTPPPALSATLSLIAETAARLAAQAPVTTPADLRSAIRDLAAVAAVVRSQLGAVQTPMQSLQVAGRLADQVAAALTRLQTAAVSLTPAPAAVAAALVPPQAQGWTEPAVANGSEPAVATVPTQVLAAAELGGLLAGVVHEAAARAAADPSAVQVPPTPRGWSEPAVATATEPAVANGTEPAAATARTEPAVAPARSPVPVATVPAPVVPSGAAVARATVAVSPSGATARSPEPGTPAVPASPEAAARATPATAGTTPAIPATPARAAQPAAPAVPASPLADVPRTMSAVALAARSLAATNGSAAVRIQPAPVQVPSAPAEPSATPAVAARVLAGDAIPTPPAVQVLPTSQSWSAPADATARTEPAVQAPVPQAPVALQAEPMPPAVAASSALLSAPVPVMSPASVQVPAAPVVVPATPVQPIPVPVVTVAAGPVSASGASAAAVIATPPASSSVQATQAVVPEPVPLGTFTAALATAAVRALPQAHGWTEPAVSVPRSEPADATARTEPAVATAPAPAPTVAPLPATPVAVRTIPAQVPALVRTPAPAAPPPPVPLSIGVDMIETATFMQARGLPATPESAGASYEYLYGTPRLPQVLAQFEAAAAAVLRDASAPGARPLPQGLRVAVERLVSLARRIQVSPEGGELHAQLKDAIESLGLDHEARLARAAGPAVAEDRPVPAGRADPAGPATDARLRQELAEAVRDTVKSGALEVQQRAREAQAFMPAGEARSHLSALREAASEIVQVVSAQQVGSWGGRDQVNIIQVQIPLAIGGGIQGGDVRVSWKREKDSRKRDPRVPARMTMEVETRSLGPVGVHMQMLGQALSLIFRVYEDGVRDFINGEMPELVTKLTGYKFALNQCVCETDEPVPEPAGPSAAPIPTRAVPTTSSLDLKA